MNDAEIAQLRSCIDNVDNQIIALLQERCGYVKKVGMTKKNRQQSGRSFIRSGREARMLRYMFEAFNGKENFPPQAAAHLWRIIIAASLSLESPLNVSAFYADTSQEVFWLAREYFGNFTPVSKQSSARRVVADVMEEKFEVGALPMPSPTQDGGWWQKLPDDVKIFACVPFIIQGDAPPELLLIARTTPEDTGDDISLISIETQQDVSQTRLKALLDKQALASNWLSVESFSSGHRIHLIELKGYHTQESPALATVSADLGQALVALRYLGGYAVPIRY